jgi:hypothetical protein
LARVGAILQLRRSLFAAHTRRSIDGGIKVNFFKKI